MVRVDHILTAAQAFLVEVNPEVLSLLSLGVPGVPGIPGDVEYKASAFSLDPQQTPM